MCVDYHNHTRYCHHAIGLMRDYVDKAEYLGLEEFGFSEHSPWMMGLTEHPLAPSMEDWETYSLEVSRIQSELRAQGSPLCVRLGIENDYIPCQEDMVRHFLLNHPVDYVIGSVHAVVVDETQYANGVIPHTDELRHHYELYFAQMKRMISSGLIDIVGHLDLPKREGQVPAAGYYDLVEGLVDTLLKNNVVVEVNTSGLDKPIREFFPAPPIIAMFVKAGVPMTLGSDAHSPDDVGRYLNEALQFLRACGATEIMTFNQRKRIGRKI